MHLQGAGRRLDREHCDRAWLAYTIGVLGRVESRKFPKLESLYGTAGGKSKPQSPEEMLWVAMDWHATLTTGSNRMKA